MGNRSLLATISQKSLGKTQRKKKEKGERKKTE